jgi:hypothetical protein
LLDPYSCKNATWIIDKNNIMKGKQKCKL